VRALRSILLLLLPTLAAAQQPTVAAATTGVRVERLPVFDDAGEIISEELIRQTMKPPSKRRFFLFGSLAGLAIFTVATRTGDRDCSIYEPCSPREKFRKSWGPWIGFGVGTLVGLAVPTDVDREAAIKKIRHERRTARLGSP
jgi:hypothetical protein